MDPPLRILHVTVALDPDRGGPPAVVARLAAAQAALGHQVHVLGHESPGAEERRRRMLAEVPGIERVRIHSAGPQRDPFREFIGAAARREVARLLPGVDILHLHEVWAPIVRVAAAEARRAGVPYVIAPHNSLSPPYIHQKRLKKAVAMRLGYRRMLRGAAAIHVLTRAESHAVEHLGLRTPRAIIPNGIFREEVEPLPPPGTFRAAHPELGHGPYILFLARLHPNKGLGLLAEAFALAVSREPLAVDAHLVVAGPDGGARADFESDIVRLGIADRVHLVGPLYGHDKAAAYADAAAFCLPSRLEGFSMSVLEALAAGAPVVISITCNFPEVAEARAGLVVPLDARSLADAIGRILADPAEAKAMGARGRAMVLARYTWPVIAQRSIDLYARCVRPASP
jgi:glycosyltransferase involved in cell wall biosynthesis